MNIGGFTEISTVDYPGEVASVVYVQGCNLHCPFCHNPTLVNRKENPLNEEEVLNKLYRASTNKIIADSIVITGGEPTIYGQELIDFIMKIKDWGYKIKLDTNGLHPETLKKTIIAGVDYVAMDIKTAIPHYPDLGKWCRVELITSINTLNMMPKGHAEFRHTCVNPFTTWLLEDFKECFRGICHPFYLQQARLDNVLNPQYVMKALDPWDVKKKIEDIGCVSDIRIRKL